MCVSLMAYLFIFYLFDSKLFDRKNKFCFILNYYCYFWLGVSIQLLV